MPSQSHLDDRVMHAEAELTSYKDGLPANTEQLAWLHTLTTHYEAAYKRASEAWDLECERDEADKWLEEMAGSPGFEL